MCRMRPYSRCWRHTLVADRSQGVVQGNDSVSWVTHKRIITLHQGRLENFTQSLDRNNGLGMSGPFAFSGHEVEARRRVGFERSQFYLCAIWLVRPSSHDKSSSSCMTARSRRISWCCAYTHTHHRDCSQIDPAVICYCLVDHTQAECSQSSS